MKFNKIMLSKIEHKIRNSTTSKWYFSLFGVFAILWILIRVIPKPSRATYPCMKVAFPLATSFVLYISGLVASVFLFKQANNFFRNKKYTIATILVFVAVSSITISLINEQKTANANSAGTYNYEDPLGPNHPIGEAKGILPGRVVWVHNPDATNENCESEKYGDGYFLDKNCDQEQVDKMLSSALLSLTNTESNTQAWDAIFKYYNSMHNKGEVGFDANETIFIKVNSVHAWSVNNNDISIKNDDSYGNVDTSPQAIMAMLRQLIYEAGVPEENIYIGDPFTHIFKHCYEKWSAEFPNINYISKYSFENDRFIMNETNDGQINYSDKGSVLGKTSDKFYACHINADYILNIPALKGHRWGGVTFFAKNHFGTHTRGSSDHLHAGLHRENYDEPLRDEYKQYRVMVDLMAHEHLGGKTLLYFGDLLWGTSYEHDPPMKFRMEPFNNDWSSSILLSLDPVAISSVALDIYQAEIITENLSTSPPRYGYVRFPAVDDYLHQAASSDWWPEGISYDPEGDGTIIGSLGVHEHWNNASDRQYSRNLDTDDGIELFMITQTSGGVSAPLNKVNNDAFKCYPNPAIDQVTIQINSTERANLSVFNTRGEKLISRMFKQSTRLDISELNSGNYIIEITTRGQSITHKLVKK